MKMEQIKLNRAVEFRHTFDAESQPEQRSCSRTILCLIVTIDSSDMNVHKVFTAKSHTRYLPDGKTGFDVPQPPSVYILPVPNRPSLPTKHNRESSGLLT